MILRRTVWHSVPSQFRFTWHSSGTARYRLRKKKWIFGTEVSVHRLLPLVTVDPFLSQVVRHLSTHLVSVSCAATISLNWHSVFFFPQVGCFFSAWCCCCCFSLTRTCLAIIKNATCRNCQIIMKILSNHMNKAVSDKSMIAANDYHFAYSNPFFFPPRIWFLFFFMLYFQCPRILNTCEKNIVFDKVSIDLCTFEDSCYHAATEIRTISSKPNTDLCGACA